MRAERPVPIHGPAAVLFDMDGTLIDSERLWDVSLTEVLRWLGGTALSPSARAETVGGSIARSLRVAFREAGVAQTPELTAEATRRLVRCTAENFAVALEWRPGAREALAAVRDAGMATALVTNTIRTLADTALDVIGRQFFDVTVCGDEVPRGKPAPDPYLRAAALLGLDPAACVAVEDSPNGIAAAEAAGVPVLAVPCEVPVSDGPRRVVRASLAGLTAEDVTAAWADVHARRAA